MSRFRYLAVDPSGRLTRGVIEAADEAGAAAVLRAQGCLPMRTEPAAGTARFDRLWPGAASPSPLSRGDVADMVAELAVMLEAGQDIDAALRFLALTAPRARGRRIADVMREAVRNGAALADAMARQAGSFSAIDVAMVRAGEAGGRLAACLGELASLLERQRALRATLRTAMIYPALLLVASMGAITLMLTWVLPQFVPLFAQSGAPLPALTAALIAAGDFVSAYGIALLGVVLFMLLAARSALRQPAVSRWADRLTLHLPLLGRLAREAAAARFCRMLGTLLGSGVPLLAALAIVQDATGNGAVRGAIAAASLSARGGAGLSAALEQADVFPVRTVHLLRLGEANARLAGLALRAADIHETETSRGVQRLVAILVPAMTIVMGAAVATIVSALLLAMLSLNDIAT